MSNEPAETRAKIEAMAKLVKAARQSMGMQEAARGPTSEETQRDIMKTMADVVHRDARAANPNRLEPAVKVGVAGAQRVEADRGWREEARLPHFGKGSYEDELTGRMCDAAFGPATPNKPDANK